MSDTENNNRRPNVILTGFMATGKSTVGRMLAARLRYGFVDTDRVIEDRHGQIPIIFSEQGEAEFRRIERALAIELAGFSSLVISTGGGLMLDQMSADALASSGLVVCLTASPKVILRRVGGQRAGDRRPLLAGADPEARIRELLAERADAYSKFVQVSTDGRPPSEVADEVARMVDG
ncbi:MAG: shikimate kinase [Actinomycetota bacterium]|jgi:shikimate kinase|nr:shikimate kinase [Actinomycetota bacterium]MDA3014681.1 shikimate kinase [Actinomycetota bacterium]